jgi:predicted ATP-dependent endonuclease of OLD family
VFKSIKINSLGPIKEINFSDVKNINVIIGENDSGKTMLLKMLYVAVKSWENYKKADEPRNMKELISDKLYWTFQIKRLSEIVTKPSENKLEVDLKIDSQKIKFAFSNSAEKSIGEINEIHEGRSNGKSIFLPAKEVLSLFKVIKKSRLEDKQFGFDDTYLDLITALINDPSKGNNFGSFTKGRKSLKDLLKGEIKYSNDEWIFKKGNLKFPIHITAEGIKKIGIIDRLIGNRYLSPESIIFIDEPESVLHPKAILEFLDILNLLAKQGVQIFINTHSYFVIKKLYLIARKDKKDIPILSLKDGECVIENLKEGIPKNPIIDTSIALYEEEVELAFKD